MFNRVRLQALGPLVIALMVMAAAALAQRSPAAPALRPPAVAQEDRALAEQFAARWVVEEVGGDCRN